MKITLYKQQNGVNTLKSTFLKHSNKELKKIYVVASEVKETGYDIIEECLIDLKAKKLILLGIDKKNTTRTMLEGLYKHTKNVYVYNNNKEEEMFANIFVFEYEGEAYVYTCSGEVTDSSLETDVNLYTCIFFNITDGADKKAYDEYISVITKETKEGKYLKLSKELIDELVNNKEIFTTKQYIHSIPSIAELLNKNEKHESDEAKEEIIPKVELGDLNDVSFEIDLGDTEKEVEDESKVKETLEDISIDTSEVKDAAVSKKILDIDEVSKEEEEPEFVASDAAIDMESLIFDTKTVKLDKKSVKKKVQKEENKDKVELSNSKKIDLNKVSNIVMELPKKPTKGQDVDSIKVPNYIKDMIPNFFAAMENGKISERKEGTYKETKISLEIIDVNNKNKYIDNAANLLQKKGQTYVMFESDKILEVPYEEGDIARIIKLSDTSYHIEIIPKSIEEYALWEKMCTNSFRGSDRQFGLM